MTKAIMNRRALLAAGMAGVTLPVATLPAAARAQDAHNPLGVPPPLEVYGRHPAINRIDLSPGGTRVAMIMRQGEDLVLIDHDLTNGQSHSLPLGNVVINSLYWVDDKRIVVTIRDTLNLNQKTDAVRGIVLNVPERKSFAVSGQTSEYDPFVYGRINIVNHKGAKAIQLMRYSRTRGYNLERLDPETGKSTTLLNDVPVDVLFSDPDGTPLFGYEYKWEHKLWRLKFNRNGSWKTVYEENGRLDTPSLVGVGRDGVSAVVYFASGERKGQYFEITPDGVFGEPLNPGSVDFSLLYHPRTRRLAGFVNTAGDTRSYDVFDPEMKAVTDKVATAFSGQYHLIGSLSEDPRRIVIYAENEFDPGTYTFIDFTTGKVVPLGRTRPDLPPEWMTAKKPITFRAADGLQLHGYLTLPPGRGKTKLPLVVIAHGGPESRDSLDFDYKAQAMASRGYAVLQVNFRGSEGYGLDFIEKGHGEWGLKMQSDLSDGVRYLADQGIIDPVRVAIWGASYGGYAALAGVTYEPDTYRCAVAVSAISDLPEFIQQETHTSYSATSGTVLYWKRFLGDEATWAARSPARNAGRIKAPLLLIHGKNDTVVDPAQTQTMLKAMKVAGKPADFVELPGEDHYMSKEATRVQMLTAVVAFIEKHNPAY